MKKTFTLIFPILFFFLLQAQAKAPTPPYFEKCAKWLNDEEVDFAMIGPNPGADDAALVMNADGTVTTNNNRQFLCRDNLDKKESKGQSCQPHVLNQMEFKFIEEAKPKQWAQANPESGLTGFSDDVKITKDSDGHISQITVDTITGAPKEGVQSINGKDYKFFHNVTVYDFSYTSDGCNDATKTQYNYVGQDKEDVAKTEQAISHPPTKKSGQQGAVSPPAVPASSSAQ